MKKLFALCLLLFPLLFPQAALAQTGGIIAPPGAVTLTAEGMDPYGHFFRLTLENRRKTALSLDRTLYVSRLQEGGWTDIPSYTPAGREAVVTVPPGERHTRLMDLRQYRVPDPETGSGRVDAGTYRVSMRADNRPVTAEFEVKARYWPGERALVWPEAPVYDRNAPEIPYRLRSQWDSPVTYEPDALYRLDSRPDGLGERVGLRYPLPDWQPAALLPGETVSGSFPLAGIYQQPLEPGRYAVRFNCADGEGRSASPLLLQFDVETLNPASKPVEAQPVYQSPAALLEALGKLPLLEQAEFLRSAPADPEAGAHDAPFRPGNVESYLAGLPDSESVRVSVFPDAAAADRYLGVTFRREAFDVGGGLESSVITEWTIPPHPYRTGRFAVVYYGDNKALTKALDRLLGYPSAVG